MATQMLGKDWTEIVIPADENSRIIRNLDKSSVVTLVFADDVPPGPPQPTWDVYQIDPGEWVVASLMSYRARVFVRGHNTRIDVVSSFGIMGNGGTPATGQTVFPLESGVK